MLTDGYNWTFYLLDKKFAMYQSTFSAGSSHNRPDILGIDLFLHNILLASGFDVNVWWIYP